MIDHNKKWLLWETKGNYFFEKSFNNVFTEKSWYGYDFFYKEIYGFEFSKNNCIYELSDCLIKENDVVVDLGANVGFFTYYAATKSKNVISVEGSPELFSCLVKNTRELGNVKYLNANIVGDKNKTLNIWSENPSNINIKLDDIFTLFNIDTIDFLKIDIEGGEYDIFEHLDKDMISRIKKIAIEVHKDDNDNNILINKINKNFFFFDWYIGGPTPQKTFYFY